ncbi:TPA: sugar phosphate isomerase/epimerase [Candidatus Bathyarchaeota archaeon]|nr:sugar phosphate isomerase/epimerase [Candidatus Bathyarchaeota archaeon]
MKVGICNEIFEGWRLERIFRFISEIGYEGVEIAPFTISNDVRNISAEDRRRILELACSFGLDIIGTHWLLVGPSSLHLTHPDIHIRRNTTLYLTELVKFTSEIGGKIMVFGSPKQRNVLKGVSKEKAWEYAVKSFRKVAKVAENYDIDMTIEPLPQRITNFINTAEEAIRLINDVSHPNFKLHLDVYGMLDERKPLDLIIKSAKDYLAHFHVNDDNGLGPGFGNVDYKPIIQALMEIGYDGFLSVEVFDFSPGPEAIASKSLETLKRIL